MAKKPENPNKIDAELLFEAISDKATEVVKELLAKGVLQEVRDNEQRTPLIKAAEVGNVEAAQMLIAAGANVNAVDVDGETALIAATYSGHLEVVKLLVAHGADLAARSHEGSTALDIAKEMDISAVAAYLESQSVGSSGYESGEASTHPDDEGPTTNGPAAAATPVEDSEEDTGNSVATLSIEADELEKTSAAKGSPDVASGTNEDHSAQEFAKRILGGGPVLEAGLFPAIAVDGNNIPDVPAEDQAFAIKTIIGNSFELGAEHVGGYILLYDFKGDAQQVFSKRPNKGNRSLSAIARHLDGLMTRQQLADCVRAVAFSKEAEASGLELTSLSFSHKIALARLKEAAQRLSLAKEAQEKRYTVQQVRDRVRESMTGISSEDRALGQAAMRRVGDIQRLSTDKEMHAFLRNKDRLKSAMKKADLLRLLDHVEDAKKYIHTSVKLLADLEQTLVDITVPTRLARQAESTDQTDSDEDQVDED